MNGATASMREKGGGYLVLAGKSEEKRPLGRPRRRREDSFENDVKEVGWGAYTGLMWLSIGTSGMLL
jgi:hypothetical protein